MNYLQIIGKYYVKGTPLYDILLQHSRSVADYAVELAQRHHEYGFDLAFVEEAAMLHDIGVFLCHAPAIHCVGTHQYIEHGFLGAELMRAEGFPQHARVCERHTGAGLSAQQIEETHLPLPHRDLMPETLTEKLICFADKFFSKTHLETPDSVERIRSKMAKFGYGSLERFDEMLKMFG